METATSRPFDIEIETTIFFEQPSLKYIREHFVIITKKVQKALFSIIIGNIL